MLKPDAACPNCGWPIYETTPGSTSNWAFDLELSCHRCGKHYLWGDAAIGKLSPEIFYRFVRLTFGPGTTCYETLTEENILSDYLTDGPVEAFEKYILWEEHEFQSTPE